MRRRASTALTEREPIRWLLRIPGSRGALAGIVGGVAMAAYEMVALWAIGPGLLAPLQVIGAAHPITEGPLGALVGIGAHLITAGYWGLKLDAIAAAAPARMLHGAAPPVLGVLWGVTVWGVMGKIVGPILNPAVATVPEPHFLIGHLIYGTVGTIVASRLLRALPGDARDQASR